MTASPSNIGDCAQAGRFQPSQAVTASPVLQLDTSFFRPYLLDSQASLYASCILPAPLGPPSSLSPLSTISLICSDSQPFQARDSNGQAAGALTAQESSSGAHLVGCYDCNLNHGQQGVWHDFQW